MIRQWLGLIFVLVLAIAGNFLGAFQTVDNTLQSTRFKLTSRPATGDIVFAAIDPKSLNAIGVWPWPRAVHASLTDALVGLDASDIAFDIDFSSASNPENDLELEQALERAGGFVMLAAFRQALADGSIAFNLPLPRFADQSAVVLVNVSPDSDGVVRRYTTGATIDGTTYQSLGTEVAGSRKQDVSDFAIDYGIDISTISVFSIIDIIEGRVDPALIAGKQVVVGASALELRDNFVVPRYGTIPGPMLQVLAAETLRQGRILAEPGLLFETGLILLIGMMSIGLRLFGYRLALRVGVMVVVSAILEVGAIVVLANPGILIDTAPIHATIVGLLFVGLARELDFRQFLLRRTRRELTTSQGILDRVISDNFDGVVVIGIDGNLLAASRLAGQVLGFTDADIAAGVSIEKTLPPTRAAQVREVLNDVQEEAVEPRVREMTLGRSEIDTLIIEYVVTLSRIRSEDENVPDLVACLTFRDITERRQSERRLTYLARHDPLTGALSRSRMVDLINQMLENDATREAGITLGVVDLSRFKMINETLGHSYGDAVLKMVVTRLKSCPVDHVARLGGDSFAFVKKGILDDDEYELFCTAILDQISDVYPIDDHQAIVGAQMGLTNTHLSGTDAELLFAHGDMALSAAKEIPGNSYAVFRLEMDERLKEAQAMESALRTAITKGELSLVFQPQVLLSDGRLIGVEALVRWDHPELGPVSPAKFIPVAEETGLIIELGRWILNAACMQAVTWPEEIRLAVNVSPTQFEFSDVVADVRKALAKSGLDPARLDIEITEGVFIASPDAVIGVMQQLKQIGVGVALDDFGTGYSSLSYLAHMPFDKVKIDKSFVNGLPTDPHSAAIVHAVMTLSESLGKVVVAEGIENADQAWMLNLTGCHIGQGYHFGRPLSNDELVARLDEGAAKPKAIPAPAG